MTRRGRAELADLEARLGYRFKDPELAILALTHPSAAGVGRSYQRLEFLGDRVLGLVVAEQLYVSFPHASEGELSVRLNKLVRFETCAEVAVEWDVGPHIRLDPGAARSGGRKKAAILSDVCETLIGAVYVDGGLEAARDLILRSWGDRFTADAEPPRDAKTVAQEWAQARGLGEPRYEEVGRSGPAHALQFIMRIVVPGYEPETGEATSKRVAEQAAARAFLDRWGDT